MTRVLVLRGEGFHCTEETAAGYAMAGAQVCVASVAQWLSGSVDWQDFELVHLPGGFTHGDALGAGQALAQTLRHGVMADSRAIFGEIRRYLAGGGKLIGVCNGMQILTRAGLLPNLGGQFDQELALAANPSGRFEDRWVRCQGTGMMSGEKPSTYYELPVRHGQGRVVFATPSLQHAAQRQGLLVLRYVDAGGLPTDDYPANPNGSELGIAGLLSADGQVLGLMPHPEAFLMPYNHPRWPERQRSQLPVIAGQADGLALLRHWVLWATPGTTP